MTEFREGSKDEFSTEFYYRIFDQSFRNNVDLDDVYRNNILSVSPNWAVEKKPISLIHFNTQRSQKNNDNMTGKTLHCL